MKRLATLLLLCNLCQAQTPDAPKPQKPPHTRYDEYHQFWDNKNLIGLTASNFTDGLDIGYTCVGLNNHTFKETWLPTQSCTSVASLLVLRQVGVLGTMYLSHKTYHHKVERIIPWVATSLSILALTYRKGTKGENNVSH